MHLKETCQKHLSELARVISQLTDEQYSRPLKVLNHSSLGGHARHVIEFYQCLLEQYSSGIINYDLRKRNPEIENHVDTAIKVINRICQMLSQLDFDKALHLQGDFQCDVSEMVDIPTSLHRELAYQLEHTVHHMALLRVGIGHSFPDLDLPYTFGIAASTIRYKMEERGK